MVAADALLASATRAHELGARVRQLPGATLAWVPGLQQCPGGMVVHRIRPEALEPDPLQWLVDLEERIAALGVPEVRLVVDESTPELEWSLHQLGFRRGRVLGLIHPAVRRRAELVLEPVGDDAGWARRLELELAGAAGPGLDPEEVVALERRRQAAGAFTVHLATLGGEAWGAVALATDGSMLRLARLVVAPEHRQRGAGAALVRSVLALAHGRRLEVVAGFAGEGSDDAGLLQRAGFQAVTAREEWARPIAAEVLRRPRGWRARLFG